MGLFDFFKKFKASKNSFKFLILGLDNAGKTTILRFLCNEDTSLIQPTQGFNAKSIQFNKNELLCFDVGGQKSLRTYWKNYFRGTSVLVFVVDAADTQRLDEVSIELSVCCENTAMTGIPILVFANKQDLPSAMKPSELCDKLGLWVVRDHPWQIYGCSAVNGYGIQEGFEWACEKALETQMMQQY